MDKPVIQDRIRQLLSQYVNRSFGDTEDVFTQGFVSSLEATQLTLQVEREFGISIRDAEVKNLRTVESIARFVQQRIG